MSETPSAPQSWSPWARYALAALRICLGLIFLWAFLDKLFGLTYTTAADRAWMFGAGEGSPTRGYLSSSFGPLGGLFRAMAGNVLVNWLFMLGLAGVGFSLTFGMGVRLGGFAGAAMVLMMYASHPTPWAEPNSTHPFLDEHITEAAAMILLALTPSGDTLGFGRWWRAKVSRFPWLW